MLNEISQPSNFASSIISELEHDQSVLDLGCGNGRDSLYFLSHDLKVTGVDASDIAIQKLSTLTQDNPNAKFICGDFVTDDLIYNSQYDYVYSRFTLHAINDIQEVVLLKNVTRALKNGGKFFIEARTIHDDLFGMGENLGGNMFMYDNHFRRFINPDELKSTLENLGFEIMSFAEGRGFSKTNNSDPVLLRITAKLRD